MTAQSGLRPSGGTDSVHRNVLASIQLEKADLLRQLAELEAVERFHAKRAGISLDGTEGADPNSFTPAKMLWQASLSTSLPISMTKHEAAAFALKRIGRSAKVGEIADFLVSSGYGNTLDRRVLFNGLFTAMKRRPTMFAQVGSAKWKLVAKDGNGEEGGD